jgi:tetratricopeptide (TPR) repeat protein
MTRIVAVCLAISLLLSPSPARADDARDCGFHFDYDVTIAACTRLLQRGTRQQKQKAATLNDRADAYRSIGEWDLAIADLNEAIRLDPSNEDHFLERGMAHLSKGNTERALEDHAQYVRLKPRQAHSYIMRHYAFMRLGRWDKAIEDLNQAVSLEPHSHNSYTTRASLFSTLGRPDRALEDYSQAIRADAKDGWAYSYRGTFYSGRGQFDRAIEDHSQAIVAKPSYDYFYQRRGEVFAAMGDLDRALEDLGQAIKVDPKDASNYTARAKIHQKKGDWQRAAEDHASAVNLSPSALLDRARFFVDKGDWTRALEDFADLIRAKPKDTWIYHARADAFRKKGDWARALEDYTAAIQVRPKQHHPYIARGMALLEKGELDRAVEDFNAAIAREKTGYASGAYVGRGRVLAQQGKLDEAIAEFSTALLYHPATHETLLQRGLAYAAKGERDKAMADLRKVVEIPTTYESARKVQAQARQRLALLEGGGVAGAQPAEIDTKARPETKPAATQPTLGRRIALVIGNSDYRHTGHVPNAGNDARTIARALRELAFAEVTERYNLGYAETVEALRNFGDTAEQADWGVVYFAGHGIEMNGTTYVIPVDAKLARDSHVRDEAVDLTRILDKAAGARRLKLVILDACRNNPFVARMARSAGAIRAVERGLGRIEPDGDVLVAYAAKHGTVAEDGTGANGPFAQALVEQMKVPGVDVRIMFGRVRDAVRRATEGRQEPFLYGSVGGDLHFFRLQN